MLDHQLGIFDFKTDYDLNIMKERQDLYDVTMRVLVGMRDVLDKTKLDDVLVHGYTTASTAAILSKKSQSFGKSVLEMHDTSELLEALKAGIV